MEGFGEIKMISKEPQTLDIKSMLIIVFATLTREILCDAHAELYVLYEEKFPKVFEINGNTVS